MLMTKAGFYVTFDTWENDYDQVRTSAVLLSKLENIPPLIELLKEFESGSRDKKNYGNRSNSDERILELGLRHQAVFVDLFKVKKQEENSYFIEHVTDTLWDEFDLFPDSEDYAEQENFMRAVDVSSIKVYHVLQDVEEIEFQFQI